MPSIKVLDGHELVDLTDEEKLFEAADLNAIGITDVLTAGVILSVPERSPHKLNDEVIQPRIKVPVVKAQHGQTWTDLSMQELGDEERVFELADANDAGITEEVEIGVELITPVLAAEKKSIVNVLKVTRPASGALPNPPGGNLLEQGIEFWAIEFDFVVS